MRFGSVCSGIEAASVAWHPLGWKAAWLSEIEPFPSAVLAHHYPDVPNLGDMTKLPERIRSGEIEAPDVFCGGTPCQAFSVAGLRKSLDDARGNLSLVFCEIANELDTARLGRGEPATIIFWENVPGVLSTADNAFGCFLAGLAGEDDPLVAPGGKWTNAGVVLGPKRAVAWRVMDAQYFGVAQRRRRVFVVASAREGFDPAAVLFEPESLRRDTAPSREKGEGSAGTLASRTDGGGFPGTDEACSGYVQPVTAYRMVAFGEYDDDGSASAMKARDYKDATDLVAQPSTFAIQAGALRTNPNSGPDGVGVQEGHAYTLEARAEVQAVCVTGQVTHTLKAEGFDASEHTAFALGRNNGSENAIAFSCKDHGGDAGPISPTLRSMGHDGSHANAGGQVAVALPFDTTQITSPLNYSKPAYGDPCHPLAAGAHVPAVAVSLRGREGGATAELGDEVGNCLRASGGGGDKAHVLAPVAVQASQSGVRFNDTVGTLDANYGSRRHNGVMTAMQVRRLTPVECERLQGFPDDYTNIPWTEYQRLQRRAIKAGASYEAELRKRGKELRGKPVGDCPDGPRYKALGNSWAVPNVRWIGERIQKELAK